MTPEDLWFEDMAINTLPDGQEGNHGRGHWDGVRWIVIYTFNMHDGTTLCVFSWIASLEIMKVHQRDLEFTVFTKVNEGKLSLSKKERIHKHSCLDEIRFLWISRSTNIDMINSNWNLVPSEQHLYVDHSHSLSLSHKWIDMYINIYAHICLKAVSFLVDFVRVCVCVLCFSPHLFRCLLMCRVL